MRYPLALGAIIGLIAVGIVQWFPVVARWLP